MSKATPTTTTNHIICNAGAGTGKTFLMVGAANLCRGTLDPSIIPSDEQAAIWDAIRRICPNPKSITTCAFNRSIADTLKYRMPSSVKSGTIHSFSYGTLRFNNKGMRFGKPTDWRTRNIVLDQLWEKSLSELNSQQRDNLSYIHQLVGLCKVTLAGTPLSAANPEPLTHLPQEVKGQTLDLNVTDEELDYLCAKFGVAVNGSKDVYVTVREVLERSRKPEFRIDFNDMIWIPVVNGYSTFESDLLMVDEAQDLNRCQQVVTWMMGKHRVYVGDRNQAIYGFGGADANSFDSLSVLCDETGGVEQFPLMETRRCGKAIVNHAKQWVPDYTAHEDNPAGAIYKPMADDFDPQPGDMLLCRTNAPLVSSVYKYLSKRQPAAFNGRELLQGLVSIVERLGKEAPVTDNLTEITERVDAWHGKEEAKLQRRRNISETALQALQDRVECIHVFMENNTTIQDMKNDVKKILEGMRNPENVIMHSSVHRGKGLEANNIGILEPQLMPHPMAKQAWEKEQERNLQYVAATRAIHNLSYVQSTSV